MAVLTDVTDLDPSPAVELLRSAGFDVHVLAWDREHVVPDAARGAVAAIAGYAQLGPDFFDALPGLRWIGTSSTGTDMVDAAAAAARGVTVQPLVDASTEEVAGHALALMLALERALPHAAAVTAAGGWADGYEALPRRLSRLTLALYGLGRIGTRVARLARPLVGSVIAHDPYVAASHDVDELVGADELLARADILSLHAPLTHETAGMLDGAAIARLPHGATVVNTARGGLVDEAALLDALDAGRLRGAGLDVLAGEPPAADNPLRAHPRVIVTPHIAFLSSASVETYERQPARNLLAWWAQASGTPSACPS